MFHHEAHASSFCIIFPAMGALGVLAYLWRISWLAVAVWQAGLLIALLLDLPVEILASAVGMDGLQAEIYAHRWEMITLCVAFAAAMLIVETEDRA